MRYTGDDEEEDENADAGLEVHCAGRSFMSCRRSVRISYVMKEARGGKHGYLSQKAGESYHII